MLRKTMLVIMILAVLLPTIGVIKEQHDNRKLARQTTMESKKLLLEIREKLCNIEADMITLLSETTYRFDEVHKIAVLNEYLNRQQLIGIQAIVKNKAKAAKPAALNLNIPAEFSDWDWTEPADTTHPFYKATEYYTQPPNDNKRLHSDTIRHN